LIEIKRFNMYFECKLMPNMMQ